MSLKALRDCYLIRVKPGSVCRSAVTCDVTGHLSCQTLLASVTAEQRRVTSLTDTADGLAQLSDAGQTDDTVAQLARRYDALRAHVQVMNMTIITIKDSFYMGWPGRLKPELIEGWHCRILINVSLVRNAGMKTTSANPDPNTYFLSGTCRLQLIK